MSRSRTLILIGTISLFLVSCNNRAIWRPDSTPPDLSSPDPVSDPEPVVMVQDLGSLASDPYSIAEVTLSGRTVEVVVRHGGGCAKHAYQLFVDTDFAESYPVQTWAYLVHDAGGDACEALITAKPRFDLTPLIDEYRRSYGQDDPIIIHVAASHDHTSSDRVTVRYEP